MIVESPPLIFMTSETMFMLWKTDRGRQSERTMVVARNTTKNRATHEDMSYGVNPHGSSNTEEILRHRQKHAKELIGNQKCRVLSS